MKFTNELLKLRHDAILAIAWNYKTGTPRTLPTGQAAIDMDDSWLVVFTSTPYLINKKDQRLREQKKGMNWGPRYISDMETQDILELADKVCEGRPDGNKGNATVYVMDILEVNAYLERKGLAPSAETVEYEMDEDMCCDVVLNSTDDRSEFYSLSQFEKEFINAVGEQAISSDKHYIKIF